MNVIKTSVEIFQHHIKNKFVRFVFVGGLNTAFGFGLYCLLIWMGLSYIWATLISHTLGVLFNFITTGRIVFDNSDNSLIFKFVMNYLLVYFINIGLNKGAQILLGPNEYISGFFALVITSLFSFFVLNRFVFNKKSS